MAHVGTISSILLYSLVFPVLLFYRARRAVLLVPILKTIANNVLRVCDVGRNGVKANVPKAEEQRDERIPCDISMKATPEPKYFRDKVSTIPIPIQGGLHEFIYQNKVCLRNRSSRSNHGDLYHG
jgi:hypothetical protein